MRAGIQAVTTVWSKESRSGDAAQRRASAAQSVRFRPADGDGVQLHWLLLTEWNDFAAVAEQVLCLTPPYVWRGLRVYASGPEIGLDLRLTPADEAVGVLLRQSGRLSPARQHLRSYAPVASVRDGGWVKIVINFRHTLSSGEWLFSQTQFNVASGFVRGADPFVADPDRIADLRLQLGW